MAEPTEPAPRKRRTARWVLITFVVLLVLQSGPAIYIVVSRDLAGSFDWPGFLGYTLGAVAVPMAIGCLGLLWRKRPGLGFSLVAFGAYVFAELGALAA